MVGAALTVNAAVAVAASPSGLVTVRLRARVAAALAMVMLAVSWVALTYVVELTVIPVPENEATAPEMKFVPVIVTLRLVAPWSAEVGLAEVVVGPSTVAAPLAALGVDHDLQTASTS